MSTANGIDERFRILVWQGAHFYLCGRFAALCAMPHAALMLWHHAVERVLKAEVIRLTTDTRGMSQDQYLKVTFGHDLVKLWSHVRRRKKSAEMAAYSEIVKTLNRCERARFPDFDTATLLSLTFDYVDGPPMVFVPEHGEQTLEVHISLEEIDLLFRAMWTMFDYGLGLLKGTGAQQNTIVQTFYVTANKHRLYEPDVDLLYFRDKS